MSVVFFGGGDHQLLHLRGTWRSADKWHHQEATLLSAERDDADPGFEVCKAASVGWERYVKTENQALVSRAMAFEDVRIYIVELPSGVHDGFCELFKVEMVFANGTRDHHLVSRGSRYVESLRKLEPDCSFGPAPGVGAIRSGGMTWIEYHTLKVEVGVSRGWPYLNRKANQWRQFPGVNYSLHSSITSTASSSVQALYGG